MNCTFECIECEDLLYSLSIACNVLTLKKTDYDRELYDLKKKNLITVDKTDIVDFYEDQIFDIDLARGILLEAHNQLLTNALKETLNG